MYQPLTLLGDLNGSYTLLPDTRVSVMGRGCVFAHRAYEAISASAEVLFLGRVFVNKISIDADALEPVMLPYGYPSGSAASNVFLKNGTVLGPPRDKLVLKGIRYAHALYADDQNAEKEQQHL